MTIEPIWQSKSSSGRVSFSSSAAGNGDQLEGRAWLVDVADRVIFQFLRRDLAGQVGIERRPVGQRQDFSGLRILHNDGARLGMGLLHRRFQFAFRDVLDFLVDGQNDILARIGLLLDAAKPFAAGVHRDQHAAGFAAQFVIIRAFDSAQAFVVHAHIAEHLRCQLAFGIKALGFFLEIDAAQIHAPGCGRRFRRQPCAPPSRKCGQPHIWPAIPGDRPW